MFMRIFSGLTALLLVTTACSGDPDNEVLAEAEERAAANAPDDGRIECAVSGETNFTRGCQTERLSGESGTTLIIRHPDGGFRRFNVLTDGRGLEAADGAEKAAIQIVESGKIRISVGSDTYIMPAKVKSSSAPKASADISSKSVDLPAPAGDQKSE
ncbi:MAG: hypothetical protein Pars2KO_30970 [Parasphingorhabdus sp.]